MELLFTGTVTNWILVCLAAFMLGLAKAGLKGVDMLNVTIMAIVLGGKISTGVVLPLLCVADIMAVRYYHRHARWDHFRKLVPWMVVGILIAVVIGKEMDETIFRRIMAVIIIITVALILFMEFRKSTAVPNNIFFTGTMGLISGITTMLGNLAGAFSNVYFLAMRLPKNDFIGTAAWVFLVINLFKVPFQAFYWHNITRVSLQTDLVLIPALVAGFFAGIKIVSVIKDDSYRKFVILLTLAGGIFIFLK